MAAPRALAKKKANSEPRLRKPDAGPGRFSARTLTDPLTGMGLRKSKLRGRLHRLACRVAAKPPTKKTADGDFKHYTYATPGSLNVRAR
jgi:hypothetical protein